MSGINMVEYGDMNEKIPQAKDYFNDSFRVAIVSGDSTNLREAVDSLTPSFVTEGISNRLLVRDFLVIQKQRLSQFDEDLEKATAGAGLDEYTRSYINALDDDLKTTFMDEDDSDAQKLKGDERLRRELRESDSAITLATHIANIDVRNLTSPEDIIGWMQNIRDSIVEELWDSVQTYKERGLTPATTKEFHDTIARIVDSINEKISGSLLR